MADPISAVIGFVVKVASATVKLYKASKIFRAVVKLALIVASSSIMKPSGSGKISQGEELKLKIDPTMPRQVAVGYVATGGSLAAAFTHTTVSSTPNNMLERIIVLSDYPINSCLGISADSVQLTFAGDINTGRQACNQFRASDGSARLWVRVYPGSFSATADSYLLGAVPGQWTAAHKGTGIAYAIVSYYYDTEAFPNGEPDLVFQLQGAKVYDDRFDGSKPARTGAQRLNDLSTHVYSENSAVVLAQFLRGFYNNGKLIAGVGADTFDLQDASLLSAYNICDQAATTETVGVTEARYRCGLMINSNEPAATAISDLASSFDGDVYDRGGVITLFPGAVRTSVLTITDDLIIADKEKSWQPKASIDSLYNCVNGTFVDSSAFFVEQSFPIRTNTTWETNDGQRLTKTINLKAVVYKTQAQRISKRHHIASRLQGTVAFQAPLALGQLEQGDWFTVNSNRWNINKTFEAASVGLDENLMVVIVGKEVSSTLDTFEPSDIVSITQAYYSPPKITPPTPTINLTGITISNTDGTYAEPALKIDIGNVVQQGPSDLVLIEYQCINPESSDIFTKTMTAAGPSSLVITEGIAAENTYQVRARTTSDKMGLSAWTAWVSTAAPNTSPYTILLNGPIPSTVDNSVVQTGQNQVVNSELVQGLLGYTKIDATTLVDKNPSVYGTYSKIIEAEYTPVLAIDAEKILFITSGDYIDGLPALPNGYLFLTNAEGVYLTNADGDYLITGA